MKIISNRQQLLNAFQTAASVAPTRSPKPILQNVKLVAEDGHATLSATDTEVGIQLRVEGIEVVSPGALVLPVSRVGSILRESIDEQLEISTDGNTIEINGSRSKFKLAAEDPAAFPEVISFEEESYHVVSAKLLKDLSSRTLFATDSDSSRYALGGVLLVMEDEKIIAVGTDGRRLAKMEGPAKSVNGHGQSDNATIVPARAMHLIERALPSDDSAEIFLAARVNDILIKSPDATIYARLVDGRFPNWQDVVAERPDMQTIHLPVGPFHAALRQASIVASEESRGVEFRFDDDSLVLEGETAEVGESRVEIPIDYAGDAITLSLDHRFVVDFLKVLASEANVAVGVKDNEQPADFRTDDGYHYVVMPLTREGRHS